MTQKQLLFILLVVLCTSCGSGDKQSRAAFKDARAPEIRYTVTAVYPHDTTSFTEGLLVHQGALYESTGAPQDLPRTRSLVGVVNLKTGTIEKKAELDRKKYFGEGIVFLGDKVYQLTYRSKVGFIYDAQTFKELGTFTFPSGEGWGMTTDGRSLIMSDGTTTLTYLNPKNFHTVKTLEVVEGNVPLTNLNELEYIKGNIYANVYTTDDIVKIDGATGRVVGRLALDSLARQASKQYPGSMEMNGIAYDPATDRVYVTGKMWPHIYQIDFVH